MFVYDHDEPIDFFNGCLSIGEFTARLIPDDPSINTEAYRAHETNNLIRILLENIGKSDIFEPKLRNNVFVFHIPREGSMEIGLVVKIDNNGGTIIMSPVKLDHLNIT